MKKINSIEKPLVLYIFGAGHSGSTLLDVLLSQHQSIIGLGEAHRLTLDPHQRKCGCGNVLSECSWWRPIIATYIKKLDAEKERWFSEVPVSLPRMKNNFSFHWTVLDILAVLGTTRFLEIFEKRDLMAGAYMKVIHNSRSLYQIVAKEKKASVIIDSTKNPLRGKLLYLNDPSRTRCIHLVRDGRAVSASMLRRRGISMHRAAIAWKRTNQKVEAALSTVRKTHRYRIRYEDVCTNPLIEINKVLIWLGLDTLRAETLTKLDPVHHQIPGNPVLFSGIEEIVPDYRWKKELTSSQISTFCKISGKLNLRYGYPAN